MEPNSEPSPPGPHNGGPLSLMLLIPVPQMHDFIISYRVSHSKAYTGYVLQSSSCIAPTLDRKFQHTSAASSAPLPCTTLSPQQTSSSCPLRPMHFLHTHSMDTPAHNPCHTSHMHAYEKMHMACYFCICKRPLDFQSAHNHLACLAVGAQPQHLSFPLITHPAPSLPPSQGYSGMIDAARLALIGAMGWACMHMRNPHFSVTMAPSGLCAGGLDDRMQC